MSTAAYPVRRGRLRLVGGRAVSKTRTRPVPGVPFAATAFLLVAALVFALVLLNIVVAQGSFRLGDLEARVAAEQAKYLDLRYEVARGEAPVAVAEAARRLGLVPPGEQRYVLGSPAVLEIEREQDRKLKGLLAEP